MMRDELLRFARGFAHAWHGVRHVFSSQRNARVQLSLAVAVVALGFGAGLETGEWLWITAAIAAVIAAEMFNTALERLGDSVSREHHPLIGQAKDAAAAAVLVIATGALVVGALIFWPRLSEWAR
jgi:diacylglycerol kinase